MASRPSHPDVACEGRREAACRGRAAIAELVQDGWWLGPAPYGNRTCPVVVEDRGGTRCTRFRPEIDQHRAPVVPAIYAGYLIADLPIRDIAARLAAYPDQYPPPRTQRGTRSAWMSRTVRRILTQPAYYVGKIAWGRTRHDVPLSPVEWVWSREPSHQQLISRHAFYAAHFSLCPYATRDQP